ncbi:MAG: hypothetical protein PHS97_01810 [Oscillospiraceae bacterium]|nr:hypothetical protein [Oscillospiraceae bacterium]
MSKSTQQDANVLLIGGNLICGTLVNRNLLSGIHVSAALLGCSPFSLACNQKRVVAGIQDSAVRVDLENDLNGYLCEHPADYLVVDLHYVCQPLIACGNDYYTKFSKLPTSAYGEGSRLIRLLELSAEEKKTLVEAFAETLLAHFPADRIALLNTHKSEYYVVGNRIRAQESSKLNRFVGECEGWFLEKIHCCEIDTLKFYFMEKKAAGIQYEDEAFVDLADNVKRFVRQMHVRRRPVFRFSLARYCRYYHNVYKNAFRAFLRVSNAVENLVFSSEPWFVKEMDAALQAAEKLLKNRYGEVAAAIDLDVPNAPLLQKIMYALDALNKEDFTNPAISYHVLFENRIAVRSLLQKTRTFVQEQLHGICPEQVTEVNYGYYFSLMQLHLTTNHTVCEKAIQTIERMQADPNVVIVPTMLDLWGSCVSRLNFQYDNVRHDYKIVYRSNLFQGLPIFLNGPAVKYDKGMFKPPITFDNKMVQLQLDSALCNLLNGSGAKWIVMDFYTLTARTIHDYQGKLYCDNQGTFTKRLRAGSVTLHKRFSNSEILLELDKLSDYLRARYGDHVIIIKHKRTEHYIDFQDHIFPFDAAERADNVERNRLNQLYTDYFAKKSGCYYIDIIDQFLADEMNLLYLKSMHYEDAFYESVQKLIRYITTEEPEQRHFTRYDFLTRVHRIARLNAGNPHNPIVQALFHEYWLDEALLKMDPKLVLDNASVFAKLYDEPFQSAEQAIAGFRCPGCSAAIVALSQQLTQSPTIG